MSKNIHLAPFDQMVEYVRNILPRIQQYSRRLDHKENYVDKPWVFIDNNNSIHEYEFCRDGRLIMSLDGQAQFGRWEYRPATQRLLIERPSDAILLQNAFINDGLMILKKSASEDPAFILVNRLVIPNLDYITYLQNYIAAKEKPVPLDKPEEKQIEREGPYTLSEILFLAFGALVAIGVLIALFAMFTD